MKYEDFLALVKSRRSIRRFQPDPIPDDYIEKMVEAARWAPSGFNSQLWEFVAIRERRLRREIGDTICAALQKMVQKAAPARFPSVGEKSASVAPPVQGSPPPGACWNEESKKMTWGWQQAPVFLIVFGDTRVRSCSPIPPVKTNDEKWKSIFYASLACAYQYAALAAVCLGLSSQWVSAVGIAPVEARIKALLGIPEPLKVFDMLAVGYPDMDPPPKAVRGCEEILHFDACGKEDFRTDEQVRAYFGLGKENSPEGSLNE